MKKLYVIPVLFLIFSQIMQAQVSFSVPAEFKITGRGTFSESTLFGHINGGAELFLEYSFVQLDYFQLEKDGNEYRMEIYRMKDPLSAYGIYSIKRYKCKEDSLQTIYNCQTSYQLSVLRGDYFITIANDKGTAEAMTETMKIRDEIIKDIPFACLNIPQFSECFKFSAPSFPILVKGKLGFQNGNPSWESFFSGFENYICYSRQGVYENEKVEMFQVVFQDDTEASRFIASKGWSDSPGYQNAEKTWYARRDGNTVVFAKGMISTL